MTAIIDGEQIHVVEFINMRVNESCMWWKGELREIKYIHRTLQGVQIELF